MNTNHNSNKVLAMIKDVENVLFANKIKIIIGGVLLTIVLGVAALRLRMEAGFEKQIPVGHAYVESFKKYRDDLIGANRLTFVVKSKSGTIWSVDGMRRLYEVTQAVSFLPNVERLGVQSLWTPNSYVNEITEEGFRADPIIDASIVPDALDKDIIDKIAMATSQGGYIGTLVSKDQTSAMVIAELNEVSPTGEPLDYVSYNKNLEELRSKFEDKDFEIQIIGFAKQIGDIADGAKGVIVFCLIALVLTAVAVYWYCHSIPLTILPVICSLSSLIWQFGTLKLMGYGLDPLAVLVPFLVFAIGVSHGVQQINFVVREIAAGKNTEEAARASFSGLLIPGTLALITAFVSFITLVMVPIPMVKELAVTASIGISFKIFTNLIMLPLAVTLFEFDAHYAEQAMIKREARSGWMRAIARVGRPQNAQIVLLISAIVFGVSVWQSSDRVVGTLQPGAPELRADSRFNLDAVSIASNYDTGLDWMTVMFEASPDSCENVQIADLQDRFVSSMSSVAGVQSVTSFSEMLKIYNQGYNEGNPKMNVVPSDPGNYSALAVEIGRIRGFMRKDCSMTAVNLFLTDHKAKTIQNVIHEVEVFDKANRVDGIHIKLAAGNAGVLAAINEVVEHSEMPMLAYVYGAIIVLVLMVYRDWRAVIACCLPLTVGNFIGYWFMKELEIGLTVATLPVMVLAVGIGVDYAFYIYNRLQIHLAKGLNMEKALENAILEVGMATIFTAITLAVGVATWAFSELKFQADMGKLLAFMFLINVVMAMTTLPALAEMLDRLFPRKGPIKSSSLFDH
jgi:uncharacterized protein